MLPDGFSVRWTKTQTFDGGTYNFALTSDDGSRLFIDDNATPVVNNWGDHGSTQVNVSKTMTAGSHKLVVEFYENSGGALATLAITNPPTAPTLAFGRSANGVDYGAEDGPAHLIFLIAAPEGGDDAHLKILAALARRLMRAEFRQSLLDAEKPSDVVDIVNREVVNA